MAGCSYHEQGYQQTGLPVAQGDAGLVTDHCVASSGGQADSETTMGCSPLPGTLTRLGQHTMHIAFVCTRRAHSQARSLCNDVAIVVASVAHGWPPRQGRSWVCEEKRLSLVVVAQHVWGSVVVCVG